MQQVAELESRVGGNSGVLAGLGPKLASRGMVNAFFGVRLPVLLAGAEGDGGDGGHPLGAMV